LKIRNKIALQFTLIVATLLAAILAYTYYFFQSNREEEIYERLKLRAIQTAKLIIEVKIIDRRIMKKIDQNTFSTLFAEKVLMFNDENKLVYKSIDEKFVYYSPELLELTRKKNYVETHDGDRITVAMIYRDDKGNNYVLVASALDEYGKIGLEKLRNGLGFVLLVSLFICIILSIVFARQSLQPINDINLDVKNITAYNLKKRLNEGNRQDEIAQLAINFNEMLGRLEQSFELQRSFVSNASHELRTPLAAIKSELQLSLENPKTTEEYQSILKTLTTDTDRLISLTNSLLQLAKSESNERQVPFEEVRIDEILFENQEELLTFHPNYSINIDFDDLPDSDELLTVKGNASLLKTFFNNFIDNACKYSDDKKALITIGFDEKDCIIKIKDNGIGIPEIEQKKIFEPFYRTQNVQSYKGFGIGLSISKRIADLHRGKITIQSKPNEGTTFTINIPHLG
jgi:two-component system, OmpR family, sensor histidine kinase ArlS